MHLEYSDEWLLKNADEENNRIMSVGGYFYGPQSPFRRDGAAISGQSISPLQHAAIQALLSLPNEQLLRLAGLREHPESSSEEAVHRFAKRFAMIPFPTPEECDATIQ